jgi:biopolymer transport protein ExbB
MKNMNASKTLLSAAFALTLVMGFAVSAQAQAPATGTTPAAPADATTPMAGGMVPQVDATGQPVLDEQGNPVMIPDPALGPDGLPDTGDEPFTAAPVEEPAADTETEVVENPYGLAALWAQGDFVSRGTLIILLIMSLGSWYIIFAKYFDQSKIIGQGRVADRHIWQSGGLQAGLDKLSKRSVYRAVAEDALQASERHQGALAGQVNRHEWLMLELDQSVDRVNQNLQGGLSFLATVGSTAPFVGLFGTVWGIYHALIAIGIAGQASIDKVAGPVGEALIMTAIGLAVAVPAVLGYNWLVRRNKVILARLRGFSDDLHAHLLNTGRA